MVNINYGLNGSVCRLNESKRLLIMRPDAAVMGFEAVFGGIPVDVFDGFGKNGNSDGGARFVNRQPQIVKDSEAELEDCGSQWLEKVPRDEM